ncbi:Mvp1 protein [Maudiozyma humilis]|uniref:Sorting nexin MVP1 n=1 Tax=Maudiozyma humilis TaxID=51915 RepID=A0AAV5RTI6_MAUHU|nr:Mvp1 protein [Kazachstania humilis]
MSADNSDGHGVWASSSENATNQWSNGANTDYSSNNGNPALSNSSNGLSTTFNGLSLGAEQHGESIFGGSPSPDALDTNIFASSNDQPVEAAQQGVWGEPSADATRNPAPIVDPLTSSLNIFADHDDGDNVFGADANTTAESETYNAMEDWIKEIRKLYNPLAPDMVTIEEIPEREGLLFKHINYKLTVLVDLPNTEQSESKSVVRRYSDFDWLQEMLIKRYPFRMIPELPPKKIGTSQNLDQTFLKKRLDGLYNFVNLILKHPILKDDDLALTFLTVPTDLSAWRKQLNNKFDTVDEFQRKKITKSFIKMWRPELSQHLNEVAGSLESVLETWSKINIIIQRSQRRLTQKIHENKIMTNLIANLQEETPKMYPIDIDEGNNKTVLDINNNLSMIAQHEKDLSELNDKEIATVNAELIPKFSMYIDILLALRNMFERYRIMATNNIPQLQRHIQIDMERLEGMKGKPDSSGTEYDKLRLSIKKDRISIMQQLNRSWLIRQCILYEFSIYQETQFLISGAFKEWVRLNSNFTELNMNAWEKIINLTQNMPTSNAE